MQSLSDKKRKIRVIKRFIFVYRKWVMKDLVRDFVGKTVKSA